jgi:hypothetical protein
LAFCADGGCCRLRALNRVVTLFDTVLDELIPVEVRRQMTASQFMMSYTTFLHDVTEKAASSLATAAVATVCRCFVADSDSLIVADCGTFFEGKVHATRNHAVVDHFPAPVA